MTDESMGPETKAACEFIFEEAGVDPNRLVLFGFGTGEMIIAEPMPESRAASEFGDLLSESSVVSVRNPKRLIRLQQMSQGGLQIDFMLVNYDMLESGKDPAYMEIKPTMMAPFFDMNPASFKNHVELYAIHVRSAKAQRQAESGIIAPPNGFRMPNLRGGGR